MPLKARDFERPGSINPRNDLAHPYSSAPSRIRTEADSNGQSFATYLATSHGVSQLSRVRLPGQIVPSLQVRHDNGVHAARRLAEPFVQFFHGCLVLIGVVAMIGHVRVQKVFVGNNLGIALDRTVKVGMDAVGGAHSGLVVVSTKRYGQKSANVRLSRVRRGE